jgi:hypothetical protein
LIAPTDLLALAVCVRCLCTKGSAVQDAEEEEEEEEETGRE